MLRKWTKHKLEWRHTQVGSGDVLHPSSL